jgi:hemolysin III
MISGIARGYTRTMSARTMSDEPIPLLRGVTHVWAFWFALAATIPLVALAPPGAARAAALFYGAGMCVLFAGSGSFHRRRCSPRMRAVLWRVDHCAIFVFIAASYTPIGLLVLEGSARWVLLGIVWTTALVGVVLSVVWIGAPRWLVASLCVGMGWAALATLPAIIERMPAAPLALFATGGLLYTAGAVVYARRRPDPWPSTFGFHEVFHVLVIAGAVSHFVAMAGWVIPAG